MTLDQINITLRGGSPLGSPILMHGYKTQEPSPPKTKRGEKTQEDIDRMLKKDWVRSAYWDTTRKTFFIPNENVEAMLVQGATDFRKGTAFKASVYVIDDFIPLRVYSGADDKKGKQLTGNSVEEFYISEYIDVRGVGIGDVKVDRCRPIFRHWGISFTAAHHPSVTDEQIRKAITSYKIGLGDFRPRFGRFQVVEFNIVKAEKAA